MSADVTSASLQIDESDLHIRRAERDGEGETETEREGERERERGREREGGGQGEKESFTLRVRLYRFPTIISFPAETTHDIGLRQVQLIARFIVRHRKE